MSNFKTHTAVNLGVALPASLVVCYLCVSQRPQDLWTMGLALTYGTLFMSPDVDLANKIRLWSLRGLLTIPFRTYALVFRHRGLSHSLFFGTLTRVVWLAMYVLAALSLFYQLEPRHGDLWHYYLRYQDYFQYGFSGFFIADVSHLMMDGMVK